MTIFVQYLAGSPTLLSPKMLKYFPSFNESISDSRLYLDYKETMSVHMRYTWIIRFSFIQKLLLKNRYFNLLVNSFQFACVYSIILMNGNEENLLLVYVTAMFPFFIIHALGVVPFIANILSISDDDMKFLGFSRFYETDV